MNRIFFKGEQILRNEAYLQDAAVTKDAAQRSPSALPFGLELMAERLRTVSPSTLLRTVSMPNGLSNGPSILLRAMSLSNGPSVLLRAVSMSNGPSTFYEAINLDIDRNLMLDCLTIDFLST